jgi:hypothetical protein
MADIEQVGDLIRKLKAQRTLRSNSAYSNAPDSIYECWQQLTEEEQTWISLSLSALELEVLGSIQRIQSGRSAKDLINLVKNRSVTEQLARKLGIKEE